MAEPRSAPWWGKTTRVSKDPQRRLSAKIDTDGSESMDTLAMKARQALARERSLEAADTFRLIAAARPDAIFQSPRLLEELHKYFSEPDGALQLSLVRVLGLVSHSSSIGVIRDVVTRHLTVKNSPALADACHEAIDVINGKLDPFTSTYINPDTQ